MPRASKITSLLAVALLPLHNHGAAEVTTAAANMTGFAPCDGLIQAGLANRLLFATDPEYEPRIESWWTLNTRLRPWCLFQPESAAEVATAMPALLGAGDGAGDWHIAVRSGGHSLGHANNIDTGVTIDLGKLNQTTYNKETNIASIGTGGRWMDVYAELHKHGVLVTGGRDGSVGVGGFLLGGGLTYFMGREAFGCDSIKNFEVVLANGTIVNANADENTDLWLALRGGGSNFGIVTRFDMEALPDKDLAYGMRFMSSNYSSQLADAIVHFTDHYQEFDGDALVGFMLYNASLSADPVAVAIHVNTDGVHNSTGFEKLRQIPPIKPDETRSMSLAEAALDSQLSDGQWASMATISFKNDKRILNRGIELHNQFVHDLAAELGAENFESIAFFQPLSKFFADISDRKGGNVLGLNDDQQYNAIIWTSFVSVKTNQQALAVAQTRMMAMAAQLRRYAAEELGAGNRLVYMNYADPAQDVLGSYGERSVARIRDVAARYDPDGAFQTRVPGGFKVSRVGG